MEIYMILGNMPNMLKDLKRNKIFGWLSEASYLGLSKKFKNAN